jgi:1-acyl-sn-glycerol-3-phosphate acyltransferase
MSTDISFNRPPDWRIRLGLRTLEPWRAYTRPTFTGLEKFPTDRGVLFVGNHTLLGVLDIPLLFAELYLRRGIFLRSLADHAHFVIPGWRDFLKRYGAVDGTPANCGALLDAGEPVLVFPGGAREVAKRKGEKYRLVWGKRAGFARMAVAHNALIVPFGAVGVEDQFDILYDANDFLKTPFGKLVKRLNLRTDAIPPVVRGIGPTPIPRRERYMFAVGDPIDPADFTCDANDVDGVWQVREAAREAVTGLITGLLAQRER